MNVGKCEWFIPDAFYPEKDNGDYVSHEAVCVLNTGKTEARIDFTLYFEDRPPMGGFSAVCPGRAHAPCAPGSDSFRSGGAIPRGVPYAIYVKSSVPVVVQYSRCDTTQPELAFMGLLAY